MNKRLNLALSLPVPVQTIERRICLVRGVKVMLDSDLAELYQVPTKVLNQAVSRNRDRFPGDFMFQLSGEELKNWRSQIVTSNPSAKMGLRRPPYEFTEQGVAMLSSVLNSKRAIVVNIAIMRAFVKLREIMETHKDLARKIEAIEDKQEKQQLDITLIFNVIKKLLNKSEKPISKIGFRT
jgi:hypothetical protein